MPGYWITPRQVEIYMQARTKGYSQMTSAAKAGISERRGRDIEHGIRSDPKIKQRDWRTRSDPLDGVWDQELAPMLEQEPNLKAITLLEYLQTKYPGKYPDSVVRTLQRRVKLWQALSGPDKEVMFNQIHEIGQQGLSDFTRLKKVTVTIKGEVFDHLLYHFRLSYSHWSFMRVIQGGESYPALTEGLQLALQQLGGVPKEHRTDSLSAAFKNLSRKAQEDMTLRYDIFCRHYGMTATRNNRGKGHENGSVESAHGHMKRRIEQALLLRGSSDFESVEAYQDFINQVVTQSNRRNAKMIDFERQALLPLPATCAMAYSEVRAIVNRSSTIEVRRVTYTVPSRLQGEVLNIRLYDDRLVCYLGSFYVVTLPRIHCTKSKTRARLINYRHIIHSLVKKPQAFRLCRWRDDLLPDANYHLIWAHINQNMSAREACKFIVGLLHLAATYDCEKVLGEMVLKAIQNKQPLSLNTFQQKVCKKQEQHIPEVQIAQHSLVQYNQFIPQAYQEGCHA